MLQGGRFGTKHAKKFDTEINELKDKQESLIERQQKKKIQNLVQLENLESTYATQSAVLSSLDKAIESFGAKSRSR